jgi:hypothetical protein
MQQLYIEQRNLPTNPATTLAVDIARHLQTRQYLGTALVVCENPAPVLSSVRKQWLKAARRLLKLRASTLNAEEILRLTHVIMHMQTIQFIAKSPADEPDATVYFATPDQITPLPDNCYTLYCVAAPHPTALAAIRKKAPASALIVSYVGDIAGLELLPKTDLEKQVITEWQQLVAFLAGYDIYPDRLVINNSLQFAAMDDALDILLGVADGFLRRAASFQRAINVAQPLARTTSEQQKIFEAVTRLAHRVQDLTPGNFAHYLVGTFDDSARGAFFLRDAASELYQDLEAAAANAGPTRSLQLSPYAGAPESSPPAKHLP